MGSIKPSKRSMYSSRCSGRGAGLLAMIILLSFLQVNLIMADQHPMMIKGCDEICVVEEGETLHSISDKCYDLYMLHPNPHVQDSDDVFTSLVIKITPTKSRKLLK